MFYKATVQAILLYGSATWNLTPTALRSLEGFHLRAARRMTGMMPTKGANNIWQYPSSAEVLEKAGLNIVEHYVGVRRQTIAAFIVNRPIFDMCTDGERMQGSSPSRQFWWEQTLDLEEARVTGIFVAAVVSDDEAEG